MVQAAAGYIAKGIGTIVGSLGASAGAVSYAYQAAYYIAQAAIYAGINYGISQATRPKVDRQLGTETQLQIDPAYPDKMIVGRRAIAGSQGPTYSYGPSNWGATIIYCLADHPCTALDRVYADGRVIHDAQLAHGVRTEITAYNDGEAHMFMTFYDGRAGQSADSQLIAASADDPEVVAGKKGAWTSNHKGAGRAYVVVELVYHPELLNFPPRFLFEMRGAPLYDRRLDTTAGGSGSHRLDDPSTWEYTDNAAVALDHYLLGYQVENDERAFGVGLRPDEIPYAAFAAAADLCDEDVVTGESPNEETIKRYRANGVIGAERFFVDIVEELQVQMAARVIDLGGVLGILGAEARTAGVSLSDQDLVRDDTVEFSDKLSFADLIGAVEGQYQDPANLWQAADYERQEVEDFQLPDGGELDTLSLPLPFEIHPRRATRLARAHLLRETLQPRLLARFMAGAWSLEVGDWFDYTDEYLGLDAVEFEVIDIIKHKDFTVTLLAKAVDPDFVAFPVSDDVDLSVAPDFAPIDPTLDAPTFAVVAQALSGGGSTKPAFKLTLLTADVLTKTIAIEYQAWSGSALSGEAFTEVIRADQDVSWAQKGVLPGQAYKFRVRADAGVRSSGWSAWSSAVTAGSTDESATTGLAAAIVGQGAMATLDWAELGATVRLEDGTTVATDALLKTILGIAAGITGQDWGATAAESSASNAYVAAFGANLLRQTRLPDGTTGWAEISNTTGLSATLSRFTDANGEPYLNLAASGTPAGSSVLDVGSDRTTNPIPIIGGKRYEFSADIYVSYGDGVAGLIATFYDSSGTYISQSSLDSSATTGSWVRLGGFVDAPSNAVNALIRGRITCNGGADPAVLMRRCMAARARSDQTVLSDYAAGSEAELGADVTSGGISAGFAGQAALAVLDFVELGATVRLEDGTTVATNALLQTALGIAAGFTGQDWGATASEADASNARNPGGANAIIDWRFGRLTDSDLWQLTGYGTAAQVVSNQLYQLKRAYVGTPPADGTLGEYAIKKGLIPCRSGDRVEASADVGGTGLNRLEVYVFFWDAAATTIVGSSRVGLLDPVGSAIGGTNLTNYLRKGGFATAPSGSYYAGIALYGRADGTTANPAAWFVNPYLARVPADKTALTEFNPGFDGQPGADVTSGGVAAGFAGQGDLATVDLANAVAVAVPTAGDLSDSYATKASKSVTTDGGLVEIEFSGTFEIEDPLLLAFAYTQIHVRARIKRGATTLVEDVSIGSWMFDDNGTQITGDFINGRIAVYDEPSAGTYTYTLELKSSRAGDTGLDPCNLQSGGQIFKIQNFKTAANAVSGP